MKTIALALSVATLSTGAMADTIIAAVSGFVQVRNADTVTSVRAGMRVPSGAEIQVPVRGSATVSMPGCSATIGPGVTPLTLNSCLQVAQAGGATGGATTGGAGATTAGAGAAGAAAATAGVGAAAIAGIPLVAAAAVGIGTLGILAEITNDAKGPSNQ